MRKQGVRSVAFGGRPREAPMSALGGVRGAQHWTLSLVSQYISAARQFLNTSSDVHHDLLTPVERARFEQLAPPSLDNMAFRVDLHGNSGVNFRNGYAEGDDRTPLQFAYESADCRLFYTTENALHPATTWEAAATVMFGGGSCVHGSVNATEPSHHEGTQDE